MESINEKIGGQTDTEHQPQTDTREQLNIREEIDIHDATIGVKIIKQTRLSGSIEN